MVEWKKLGEICEIKTGKGITQKDCSEEGVYPVISGGQTPMGMYSHYNRDAETVTISRVGAYAGFVSFIHVKFYLNDKCFSIIPLIEELNKKFLFCILKGKEGEIKKLQSEGGVPTINTQKLGKLIIPIPPLSEQQRIVGILDTFTASIDNLKEQIAQRRKQYEYYRDQLLDLEGKPGVEMKMLGDLCLVKTGTKPVEIKDSGSYKYINAGTSESGFVDMFNCKAYVVTTPSRGQGGIGFVGYQNEDFWLGPLCYQIRSFMDDCLKSKFLYYFLQSHNEEILKYKSEGGTPAVNANDIKKINIPVPSFQEQSRIVGILDTFEASIQNLEAQLKEREKQYEYYRNKLLSFE